MMRRVFDGLGVSGLLALAGVLLLAWMQWTVLRPLEREQSSLAGRLIQARTAGKAIAPLQKKGALAEFHAHFAKQGEATDQLAKLYGIARNHGLDLAVADYQMNEVPNLKLSQYSIILPLHGSYAQIRGFTEDALQELGGLVVEQVNFRRSQAQDTVVDADLRLSLFNTVQP